jgi:insulysin
MHHIRPIALWLVACAPHTPPQGAFPKGPVEVVAPPLHERAYRSFSLDNGIRAVAIHDPDTDMAAASLNVQIGHYADPTGREGLAHFLEHMLFLGTEKYPEVGEYRQFVQDNGGGTNAYTSGENTQYHFDIEQGSLEPALDRFAQFFISPTLDAAYVQREREAVNSEYSLKIKDHARRQREVRKSTANPAHPESQFSVGNMATLGDDPVPVHEDLLALYQREYTPQRMTVSVLGTQSLDALEELVRSRFSEVQGGDPPTPEQRTAPFLPEQLGARIEVVPLQERRELEMSWVVPDSTSMWPERPVDLISSILGDEGEGSLFQHLEGEGLIEWLSSGAGNSADDHDLLKVSMGLTPDGVDRIDTLVGLTLRTIEGILPEQMGYRHEEARRLSELSFRFQEEPQPSSAVTSVARSLATYPAEHVLDYWAVYADHNAELLAGILESLTPQAMRLMVTHPDAQTDQEEPRYKVPYGIRPFTEQERAAWASVEAPETLRLPAPNVWLPDALDVVEMSEVGAPVQLKQDGRLVVWHLEDGTFGTPRATTFLRLFSPVTGASIDHRIRGQLLAMLLRDSLEAWSYPLKRAGLGYDVSAPDEGMRITVSGYDDKQAVVLRTLLERLAAFEPDPSSFEIERARLARQWRNQKLGRPVNQTTSALSRMLDPRAFDQPAAADRVLEVTMEELSAFHRELLAGLRAQLLVVGNMNADQVNALGEAVDSVLLSASEDVDRGGTVRRRIPSGVEVVRDLDIDHDDSTIAIAYQGKTPDMAERSRYRMLGQLLQTPFFNVLRTQEQLGYVVRAGSWSWDALPGLRMYIQSTNAGPVALQQRIDAFLGDQREQVANMSAEDFQAVKDGLIASLEERETQLRQRFNRLHSTLYYGRDFDDRLHMADEIRTLTQAEMVAFYDAALLADDVGRVVVRSFGAAHPDDKANATAGCADDACATDQLPERFEREL